MASPFQSLLERGGRLGWWIRALLFLRLVSALVHRLRSSQGWIADAATSLFVLVFILHLSWTLLSRHVFPFRIQDFSGMEVAASCQQCVCEARNVMAACTSQCTAFVRYSVARGNELFYVIRARLRQTVMRDRGEGPVENTDEPELQQSLLAVEMVSSEQESLTAPTVNVMDRLEDVGEQEQVSPKLQDKKEW